VTAPFISRQERFPVVPSTNDVVRTWLADGVPEVCLAVADEQTAGRGRLGRAWVAPPGAALLLSLGFRPTWLAPEQTWRLAATVSLAMADAAEEVAGLPDGIVRLKWPNDLVIEIDPMTAARLDDLDAKAATEGRGTDVRKLAGLLGESDGVGTDDPTVVVGIGINADWSPQDFPAHLAGSMTSLREASRGRPIDLALLLDAFLSRLEVRIEALRAGRFDIADWTARQSTTRRTVRLIHGPGDSSIVRAVGVDAASGALVVVDPADPAVERHVHTGDIEHVRLVADDARVASGV
jgi:BirA family biotin operon repressor/biotin-[acetyl-CoA-carboxylase] ligase